MFVFAVVHQPAWWHSFSTPKSSAHPLAAAVSVLIASHAPGASFFTCRAFAGYWSVEATEETAMNGVWRMGPGVELFQALQAQLGEVPILAEDLGIITKDVVVLRWGWQRAGGMCHHHQAD